MHGPQTWRQVKRVSGEVGRVEGVSDVDLPLAANRVVKRVHELVRRVDVVRLLDLLQPNAVLDTKVRDVFKLEPWQDLIRRPLELPNKCYFGDTTYTGLPLEDGGRWKKIESASDCQEKCKENPNVSV